jgi:transposase
VNLTSDRGPFFGDHHSISETALRRWTKASEVEQGTRVGLTVAEKAEIRELKRELQTVRMERDILKKAVGFFAKENQ